MIVLANGCVTLQEVPFTNLTAPSGRRWRPASQDRSRNAIKPLVSSRGPSAIPSRPDPAADAHLQTGITLLRQGRFDEAARVFTTILAADRNCASAWHMMGMVFHQVGRYGDAIAHIQRCLALDPRDVVAHSNLGDALRENGDLELSLQSCERALALDPGFVHAQVNRANALYALGRIEQALVAYDAVLARHPDRAKALGNRATILQQLGRHADALEGFERAMAIEPAVADFKLNASYSYLALGDYPKGLALYEWRWRSGHGPRARDRGGQPPWLGGEPLAGKTILLHAEQGLGDTLQFCRYAGMVADLGARVVLEAPRSLQRLMQSLKGPDLVLGEDDPPAPYDLHCPLMSLPLAFGSTVSTLPAQVPYLRAPEPEAAAWSRRLGPPARPRIGLVWSGGHRPGEPHLSGVNGRRNMPLAQLAALKGVEADFYSLQKGDPAEGEFTALDQDAWDGPRIVGLAGELGDFADTAALIEALDLVLTVDTAIAHLAGALGKPVWILNRFDACWRWLTDRDDSPWYPTARLFRQTRPGDWDSVMAAVRRALADWIALQALRG
jgi:Tfp pilus assembly protein PilF